MRIVKYNNNNVFPSLMNEFFNDDFGMNLFNRRHSVPSVNSVENNDSFEIDLAAVSYTHLTLPTILLV